LETMTLEVDFPKKHFALFIVFLFCVCVKQWVPSVILGFGPMYYYKGLLGCVPLHEQRNLKEWEFLGGREWLLDAIWLLSDSHWTIWLQLCWGLVHLMVCVCFLFYWKAGGFCHWMMCSLFNELLWPSGVGEVEHGISLQSFAEKC
jgi:hypothetical protein